MKKLFACIMVLPVFFIAAAQTNEQPEPQKDPLALKTTEYNFGKIPQGKPVYVTFDMINTGSTPLKIDEVHAPCGCTTPEWSREPIAPGATAPLKVGYNAAAEGYFEKTIHITYNDGMQTKTLRIKGTVWKAPEGSAPSNASISFLKNQTF